MMLPDLRAMLSAIGLTEYQVERHFNDIVSDIDMNHKTEKHVFSSCPKCGVSNPRLILGGKAGSRKQMYRCCSCRKRFTVDHGSLTFYSHQDESKWNDFISDTLQGSSLRECAERIGVNPTTAFNMRHRFLEFAGKGKAGRLSGEIEADETYFLALHKGIGSSRLECHPGKRGLSKQQVCMVTGTERDGRSFCRCENVGVPTQEDVVKALSCSIEESSVVYVDGSHAYRRLSTVLNLLLNEETPLPQMRNANGFHSSVKSLLRRYRGISAKYANRYAVLFSLRWRLMKHGVSTRLHEVLKMLSEVVLHVTIKDLRTKWLFEPKDLEWRVA